MWIVGRRTAQQSSLRIGFDVDDLILVPKSAVAGSCNCPTRYVDHSLGTGPFRRLQTIAFAFKRLAQLTAAIAVKTYIGTICFKGRNRLPETWTELLLIKVIIYQHGFIVSVPTVNVIVIVIQVLQFYVWAQNQTTFSSSYIRHIPQTVSTTERTIFYFGSLFFRSLF